MLKSNKRLLLELQEPENHSKFEFLVPRRDEPALREPSLSEMARRRQTEPQTTVRALVAGTAAHFHGLLQPPCHLKALEQHKCYTDISLRPFLLLLFLLIGRKVKHLVRTSVPIQRMQILNCSRLSLIVSARRPVQWPGVTALRLFRSSHRQPPPYYGNSAAS